MSPTNGTMDYFRFFKYNLSIPNISFMICQHNGTITCTKITKTDTSMLTCFVLVKYENGRHILNVVEKV